MMKKKTTNKKIKEPNIIIKILRETDSIKKISLIRKRNNSLKRSIGVINIIFYILYILAGLPFQLKVMSMIEEISSNYNYFTILGMCMILYCAFALLIYYCTAYYIVKQMQNEIHTNINKIDEIRKNDKTETDKILAKIKFDQIYEQIKDY